jgi:hypothetical protein
MGGYVWSWSFVAGGLTGGEGGGEHESLSASGLVNSPAREYVNGDSLGGGMGGKGPSGIGNLGRM